MRALADAPHLAIMGTERGREIGRRFEALEIGDREWHKRTGIDRKTLHRAIEGLPTVRASTYEAIESHLDKLEARLRGVTPPPAEEKKIGEDYVEFTVEGNFGVRAVVRGPVENIAELQKAVDALIRDMRENPGPQQ